MRTLVLLLLGALIRVTTPAVATWLLNSDGYSSSGYIRANPIHGDPTLVMHGVWPPTLIPGGGAFNGGVFDGKQFLWLVPFTANGVVRVDRGTGQMTLFDGWPFGLTLGPAAFIGGVCDGRYVWLVPATANGVVRVDVESGVMQLFDSWPLGVSLAGLAFAGGVFDGQSIWLVPYGASAVVRLDPATGLMTHFDAWPAARGTFVGGVFDGQFIWLVPHASNDVIRMARDSGTMTLFSSWPSGLTRGGFGFAGGVFDGSSVWLVPCTADGVVRITTQTGDMTLFNAWPPSLVRGSAAFVGGVFDGRFIWLVPRTANGVVRVLASSGEMTLFATWPVGLTLGNSAFEGGVFDGHSVWLVPRTANGVIALQPNDLGGPSETESFTGSGGTETGTDSSSRTRSSSARSRSPSTTVSADRTRSNTAASPSQSVSPLRTRTRQLTSSTGSASVSRRLEVSPSASASSRTIPAAPTTSASRSDVRSLSESQSLLTLSHSASCCAITATSAFSSSSLSASLSTEQRQPRLPNEKTVAHLVGDATITWTYVAGVAFPTSVASGGRSMAVVRQLSCSEPAEEEEPGWTTNPLVLRVGRGGPRATASRGAVVGALFVLYPLSACVICGAFAVHWRKLGSAHSRGMARAMSLPKRLVYITRLPFALAAAGQILGIVAVQGAIPLLQDAVAFDLATDVVLCVLSGAMPVATATVAIWHSTGGRLRGEVIPLPPSAAISLWGLTWLEPLLTGGCKWTSTATVDGARDPRHHAYGGLYAEYRTRCAWFLMCSPRRWRPRYPPFGRPPEPFATSSRAYCSC